MKIKTEELNKLVNTVAKGASNNKLIPLTQMIGIKIIDEKLYLLTTNATNYFTVSVDVNSNENIDICVNCDTFVKLVSKTTSEDIELKVEDKYLSVRGNGEYKLEMLINEEGTNFSFPMKTLTSFEKELKIKKSDFINIETYNKQSLATTLEMLSLTGYYVADKVISTDSFVMTINKSSIFEDLKLVLSPTVVNLLASFKEEEITLKIDKSKLYFESESNSLYTVELCKVEDYPLHEMSSLLEDLSFESFSTINLKALLNILDRLSLFVTPYDSNIISLNFNDEKLYVSSKKETGVEILTLKECNNFKPFTCDINLDFLKEQAASLGKEEVKLYFGSDNFIKLESENITKLICLAEE